MRSRTVLQVVAVWLAVCACCITAAADELPLVRVAAPPGTHGPLVLVLSGDGDWAAFVRELAEAAAAAGSPVLGLESRSYLTKARTPDEAAAALASAVRAELEAQRRDSLVVIGYSRGADIAPFIVNRWPDDLRARVRNIAFVGLSERASFAFHLEDLVRDVERPTDLPTRPEIEKLAGIPLLCVRGESEKGSFCDRPVDGMQVGTHAGGHRAAADAALVALVLRGVAIGN